MTNRLRSLGLTALLVAGVCRAQGPPPRLGPGELERLVDRIALYPDTLLGQVLAAATYSEDIPEAYRWADQHHYLSGKAMADAITADQLPWDPSVQALLPFPSVLQIMSDDMNWTRQLGDAFLSQQADVMDAVQRDRKKAYDYGYLRSNRWVVVTPGPYWAISPVDPLYVPVPWWDPAIVYFPPAPGVVIGVAIRFGYGVTIGPWFRPWGWGYCRFDWGAHVVFINNAPWRRVWENRLEYRHPYEPRRFEGPRPEERHPLQERSPRERQAPQSGQRGGREEHKRR